jgi:hypothetical protein
MLQPGTVYTFRLENGLYGACRVLRGPEKDEKDTYEGHSLVHATKWVGDLPLDLKHADLRKVLRDRTGAKLYWMEGRPPETFKEAGIVAVRKAEQSKICRCRAPWGVFLNVVLVAWEAENEPAGREKKVQAAEREAESSQQKRLAELEAKEHIDLSGLASSPPHVGL